MITVFIFNWKHIIIYSVDKVFRLKAYAPNKDSSYYIAPISSFRLYIAKQNTHTNTFIIKIKFFKENTFQRGSC